LEHPEDYVLGVRDFSTLEVKIPWRSRFGNNLTEKVFKFFTGTPLKDTQTGLRVYPKDFMREALSIKPDRYEFELEALLRYYRCGMGTIRQVPITTVYEENNPSSHFNPIKDSIRIYAVFFKFIGASVISSVIDFIIFSVMILCLGPDRIVFGSVSRAVSSIASSYPFSAAKGENWAARSATVMDFLARRSGYFRFMISSYFPMISPLCPVAADLPVSFSAGRPFL